MKATVQENGVGESDHTRIGVKKNRNGGWEVPRIHRNMG
jgi:hypothetical protein